MTNALARAFPPPADWQAFERLAFDLYAAVWKATDTVIHGRRGQAQAGVDVYGTDTRNGLFTGVQCKGKDQDYGVRLTIPELQAEVVKAKTFTPPLDVFILATTADDDAPIQAEARKLSAANRLAGLFEVRVEGWGTLKQQITSQDGVFEKHFPDLAPTRLLDRFDQADAARATDTAAILAATSQLSGLLENLGLNKGATDAPDPLNERIKVLSTIIGQGEPEVALRMLEALERDEGSTATARNQFRIRANIGSARMQMGDYAGAARDFRASALFDPTWPHAMAIAALADLLEDNKTEAFAASQAALVADPASAQAASVLVASAPDSLSVDEIEALLPAEVELSGDLLINLHNRASRLGDPVLAGKFADLALADDPDDWRAHSARAETDLQPIFAGATPGPSYRVEPDKLETLARATNHLRTAWDLLKRRHDAARGAHLPANLISALELVGEVEEAATVLRAAVALFPDQTPIARLEAQRLAFADEWDAAAIALARLEPADIQPHDRLLAAQIQINTGRADEALANALAVRTEASDQRFKDFAGSVAIEAAAKAGDGDRVATALMDESAGSIVIRSVAVMLLDAQSPARQRALAEIGTLIDAIDDPRDTFHAAEALYAAKDFSRAADLYSQVSTPDGDLRTIKRRLIALYNSDRRREARELFESLPSPARHQKRNAELGAAIYTKSGLLALAEKWLDVALKADPSDLENRLSWVRLQDRLGALGKVRAWLKTVPADLEGSPQELMEIARTMDRLGSGSVILPLAYRALRAAYDDSRMHLAYTIGIFITGRTGRREIRVPTEVQPDTAVTLQLVGGSKTLTYVLETLSKPRIELQEIPADGDLASKLLGLSVGDEVELSNAGPYPKHFKVTAVSDKFLYAHHRSLADFQAHFPDDKNLGQFEIDPEENDQKFEPIFESVRQRAARGKEIEQFYRTGSIPLALFGKWAGVSPFDIWDAIRHSPDLILMTCIGTAEEMTEGGRRVASAAQAVIDPVTLYGLVRMGIHRTVLAAFPEVGVVQGAIDLLRILVEDRKDAKRGQGGTLHMIGEEFAFVETSADSAKALIAEAEEVLAVAEGLPLYAAEPDRPLSSDSDILFDNLPDAYADTVYAAQTQGRVLLSDDRAFRLLAEGASGVSGIWSQAAIASALQSGVIGLDDATTAVIALVRASSTFTMLPTAVVLHAFRRAEWRLEEDTRALLHHGTDPNADRTSAQGMWASILLVGWGAPETQDQAMEVAKALLETAQERDPQLDLEGYVGGLMAATEPRFDHTVRYAKDDLYRTTYLTRPDELRKPALQNAHMLHNRFYRALDAVRRSVEEDGSASRATLPQA